MIEDCDRILLNKVVIRPGSKVRSPNSCFDTRLDMG
jgi:hypothetical protein